MFVVLLIVLLLVAFYSPLYLYVWWETTEKPRRLRAAKEEEWKKYTSTDEYKQAAVRAEIHSFLPLLDWAKWTNPKDSQLRLEGHD